MRRLLFVITAVLVAAYAFPQQPDYVTTAQDSTLAVKIMASLDGNEPTASLMLKASEMLMGQPYVAATLDETDRETTSIYLTRTDCILFVETCLNLALTARSGGNFIDFAMMVQQSRYRNGQPSDYNERLHYTTEWIRHNEARGILRDITIDSGGKVYDHPISYMSTHPELYPKLDGSISRIERSLNEIPLTCIPKSDVAAVTPNLQPGDIICFVATIDGLDIQHVAIHIGNGRFMHASTSIGKVVIEERTLAEYCNAGRTIAGIKVVRVTD